MNEIMAFAATSVDLEGIMFHERSQTKINTLCYHLYVNLKNKQIYVTKQKD